MNKLKLSILLFILIFIILIILGNIVLAFIDTETNYNWVFNTYNDNNYILLFIIILLLLIIYSSNYISKKQILNEDTTLPTQQKSNFSDISYNDIGYSNSSQNGNGNTTLPTQQKSNFTDISYNDISNSNSNVNDYTIDNSEEQTPIVPEVQKELMANSSYKPPVITNPYNNLFISNTEKAKWKVARSLLDGNEDSLPNTNGSLDNFTKGYGRIPKNDILQTNSTLFNQGSNRNNVDTANTSSIANYASLDSLGKGLTDTLGGIHTELGYTVLDEQLGTFKKEEIYNPYAYDDTANYNTGMNANTVDGVMNLSAGNFGSCGNGQPVFIQKDFDGVANIFAPNIVIQNPPLTKDGYPDISIRM